MGRAYNAGQKYVKLVTFYMTAGLEQQDGLFHASP